MQTNFAPGLLDDPHMASSEKILRTCVHCGFCTATCPTYVLGGDELDSPRGRIYLIKDMLETNKPASTEVVTHIDRCLSCLSCMTTCPSGVHYMHLVDHARAHIEKTYRRPFMDRLLRQVLAMVLPYPGRFRLALAAGRLARPLAPVLEKLPGGARLKAMLDLVPRGKPGFAPAPAQTAAPATGKRVVILEGCAQPVLRPETNAATRRLLARLGVAVVAAPGEGCCGALVHHMGREEGGKAFARRNIDAWTRLIEDGGLDAIIITASGCGTTIKDYGFMFRDEVAYADKAARVSALAKDITEYLATLEIKPAIETGQVVAYHSACSMQHGQQIKDQPKNLLRAAGFKVKDVPEGHICCGSAGTYNILQPKIADQLRDRKVKNIQRTKPDLIATGNIGCITQIGLGTDIPIVHTVELLDWATGGPMPAELEGVPAAAE
jgi:glycolate oxidase iron-sulfur subunit